MKKAKFFVCIPVVILLLFGTVAYAAENITDIEQKWLDFQRAVKAQQVKDGIISQKDADNFLSKLQSKISGSGDAVYEKIKKAKVNRSQKFDARAVDIYAKLTNRSKEDVLKDCEAKKMTIWQLAKSEGKLEDLKNAILSNVKVKFSQLVKDGKMTQQEMDNKLQKIQNKLNSKM